MSLHKALRDKIDKGLYIQNLDEMISICRNALEQVENPLPYFVIGKVLATIREEWEGEPVTVEEVHRIEMAVIDPILRILDWVEHEESKGDLIQALNNLINAFKGRRK